MSTENSIELFNCTLCSYCETSLDGLAAHIRKHIKPDPEQNRIKEDEHTTKETNGEETTILVVSCSDEPTPGEAKSTSSFSPRIEVSNPRTIALNGSTHYNAGPNDTQSTQPVVSTYKAYYSLPQSQQQQHQQHQQQQQQQQVVYSRNIPQQQSIRGPAVHNDARMDPISGTAPPPPPRYMLPHHREPQYVDMNGGHHPYPTQYVGGAPTHPHGAYKPRNIPPNPQQQQQQQQQPGNHGNRGPSNDNRMRATYDVVGQNNIHHAYHNRYPIDPNYRYNQSKGQRPPPPPPQVGPQAGASPLNSPFSPPLHATQNKPYDRVNSVQFTHIQKHTNPHSVVGIPNAGSVYLNPEQVFGSGNPALEQLAGVLVVPLKKTCEVACQTEGNYSSQRYSDMEGGSSNSRGIQTDILMSQVRESQSGTQASVFGTFQSTDDLHECMVCGDEFASDHHLQEHISKVHTHVCEKCEHTSSTIHEHNMHITDCGQRDTHVVCLDCHTTFPSLKKLNQHRSKIHNIRMPFRCGVCNVPFESHEAVMSHISTHDDDVPEFKCRYCTKVFQSSDGLSKHVVRHKTVDVHHECRFCKRTFNTARLLNDHISYVHVIRDSMESNTEPVMAIGSAGRADKSMAERSMVQRPTTAKYPLCRFCDLSFKNKELLAQHVEKCSKNRDVKVTPFVCDVCKEYYASDLHRKQHTKKEHKRDSGFRCPKCSKIYRTWSRLKFHTKQQHLKKICPECPMIFTKEHILRKHQEENK